jgi:hypothetical protein
MTMRLAPNRSTIARRQLRRLHVARATVTAERERDLTDERRWRMAGGPEDRATYTCSCGKTFEAPVSTSVACPGCGCGQAW